MERTRGAVLAAARTQLDEFGWESVTLAKVADRSGIARATLYRHWPNRLDLLDDLIREEARLTHTTPVGDLREDLIAELEAFQRAVTTSGLGHAIIAIGHRARTEAAFAELNQSMLDEGTRVLRGILQTASTGRKLSAELTFETATAELVGPVLYRFLFADQAGNPVFISQIVDDFIRAHSSHPGE